MLRVVFFDAAGTLFKAREPVEATYARIARRYGIDAGIEAVAAGFHRAFHMADGLAFGPGIAPDDLRRLEREWWRERVRETFAGLGSFTDFDAHFHELFSFFADPAHWMVVDDAPAVLTELREGGLGLGVVSNFDHRLYRILEGLGLRRYFDSLTISSEAGWAKPSPELFKVALGKHRAGCAEALHIGDSEALDLGGAAAAGIAAVLVEPERMAPPSVDGRIARVGGLRGLVEVIARLSFP